MIDRERNNRIRGHAFGSGSTILAKQLQIVLLLVVLASAVRYQVHLFNVGAWGDEYETMVASKMMATGLRLYSDIFNQHGPLIFAFGVALDTVVDATIADYRLIIAALQWLMIGSLMHFSLKMPSLSRMVGLSIIAALTVIALPLFFGQMFLYQTVGGIFSAAAIALLVLPVLRNDREVSASAAFVGGFLLGCLPFLAFTYAAASAGLILCSLTRSTRRSVAAGVTLAVIFNVMFIMARCSVRGFIADHLYLNLMIYPAFGDNSIHAMWENASKLSLLTSVVGLTLVLATASFLVMRQGIPRWRSAVFVLAIASFLMRGTEFQALPFYYALLPLVLAAMPWKPLVSTTRKFVSFGIVFVCLISLWLIRPAESGQIPSRSFFSELVKRFTVPSDRIISYSFDPLEYLLAHRLPASGAFYFLPQQAVYNEHPVLGVVSDPCQDIRVYKPKFMKIDKWLAWGTFPWESYGTCVDKVMQESYVQIKGTPVYVRSDIWPSVEKMMHEFDGVRSEVPPNTWRGLTVWAE